MKPTRPARWHWEPTMKFIRFGFSLCVFVILALTVAIFSGAELLLAHLGLLGEIDTPSKAIPIVGSALASLPLGAVITFVFIRIPMRPIKNLLAGMTRLANGHFDERLDLGAYEPLREMSDTFNSLACELENTEMLRSDFINNFSHEFKTPIVSINGFAKLLQRGDLTPAQQREYIDVIADESTRLAHMATNVLHLTKVENQSILTNVQEFNLSEQLRKCILLLEKKWTAKDIDMQAEFQEYLIHADEELLAQVWVNLLDNAIKFSPHAGPVSVSIVCQMDTVCVSVSNGGKRIPLSDYRQLFDKFWQGDTSHAGEGAGVGLSIAQKIVHLHNGEISVCSTDEMTTFTVTLPV